MNGSETGTEVTEVGEDDRNDDEENSDDEEVNQKRTMFSNNNILCWDHFQSVF